MTNPLPGNTGNGKFLRVMDTNIDDPLVRNLLLTLGNHALDSVTKPRCRGCRAGYFCVGDGNEERCGVNSSTEFSFGSAASCSPCPEGWLCANGTALPCPESTHVNCNETFCPENCFDCEPGTVCWGGMKQDCTPGRYSNGKGFPCKLCPPGSFNNETRAQTCECCPDGYSSTYMKTSCWPCPANEWAKHENFPNCSLCQTCFTPEDCEYFCLSLIHASDIVIMTSCPANEWAKHENFPNCSLCQTCFTPEDCPCLSNGTCFPGVSCLNVGVGLATCGPCPKGYKGDGRTCDDIDECARANPCYESDKCENRVPGYQCAACPDGFRGNAPSGVGLEDAQNSKQVCEEIDECKEGISSCDPNSQCINTNVSFLCGPCHPGFIGDGYTGCHPGDLCTNGSHTCHENAQCAQTGAGRFKCRNLNVYLSPVGVSANDTCPTVSNANQTDSDSDGVGDVCDNCPADSNNDQSDTYQSGYGDVCSGAGKDKDGDGVPDGFDNCVDLPNGEQADVDNDTIGDACDDDQDGDGISNRDDNCRLVSNPGQEHVNLAYDAKAQAVGDVCVDDFDGDGVKDNDDQCPYVEHMSKTSFTDHFTVDLYPGHSDQLPVWRVAVKGIDVEEITNTASRRPSMLIGTPRYGPVDYSGVLYIQGRDATDYVGVVFGYQSNRKFYVVMWRRENSNFQELNDRAAIKGLQLKVRSLLGNNVVKDLAAYKFEVNQRRELEVLMFRT
ncbi:cartilage oligomeric matrix protein-like [Orbicella faveolata]|uniref:cartilage oligomeric matrix protein-like n=1 Tax=Orbicella faveolata TaxID=48498 RepID=UPI0009E5BB7D|nr:cartilage oligomeric matrix protein-like [Orbicella faveolata]